MPTTITLAGITFTGTGVYDGFTYDKLDNWQGVDNTDQGIVKRPNQPGAFMKDRTDVGEKVISIEGQFFGADEVAAQLARELLATVYDDGREVIMSVSDPVRTTSRAVKVAAVRFPWTPHREFNFTIDVTAADPRRYGPAVTVSNTLAVAGSGLDLDFGLDYPVDFGTTPNDGRLVLTNLGGTETTTTFIVRNGSLPDGADIVNVTTGERLTYTGPIANGDFIEFDPRVQAVFINGTNPAGRFLPNPAWWSIPRGKSIEVGFVARGTAVGGTPRLEATTRPAWY